MNDQPDFLLVILREVASLGGILIILYLLLWMLNSILTCQKFQDYLVSELYSGPGEKVDDTDHDKTMLVGNQDGDEEKEREGVVLKPRCCLCNKRMREIFRTGRR